MERCFSEGFSEVVNNDKMLEIYYRDPETLLPPKRGRTMSSLDALPHCYAVLSSSLDSIHC